MERLEVTVTVPLVRKDGLTVAFRQTCHKWRGTKRERPADRSPPRAGSPHKGLRTTSVMRKRCAVQRPSGIPRLSRVGTYDLVALIHIDSIDPTCGSRSVKGMYFESGLPW